MQVLETEVCYRHIKTNINNSIPSLEPQFDLCFLKVFCFPPKTAGRTSNHNRGIIALIKHLNMAPFKRVLHDFPWNFCSHFRGLEIFLGQKCETCLFSAFLCVKVEIDTWNLKHLFINGCFNWMIPNLYIGNGCFTKHLFINGCLGHQVEIA